MLQRLSGQLSAELALGEVYHVLQEAGRGPDLEKDSGEEVFPNSYPSHARFCGEFLVKVEPHAR